MARVVAWRIGRLLRVGAIVLALMIIFPAIVKLMGSSDTVSGNEIADGDRVKEPSEISEENELPKVDGESKNWEKSALVPEKKETAGPGENGWAFHLPRDFDKDKKDSLYRQNGFNALASDYIALNRSIKDLRHEKCRTRSYLAQLPTVSVILPFHNEHWTTLLRSVHSIVNRSPKELLREVILADDASNKDFLKTQLEEYIEKTWPNKLVKLVRTEKREGLIRARLLGAKAATSDVILFLDSHSECGVNWLPPLLEPIAHNYRTAVCPFVDVIDYETFELRAQDEGARGAFDWELYYKRLPLLPQDIKRLPEPFKDPVMAGGYFAMSRKYFWELGGYDEGLDIWGGEQYELSFKIWQCGGTMVDAPCSRVGHIYRKFAPFPNPGVGDFIGRNYKRVAEVWMDEYKEYIYARRPHYRNINPGDLTKQKAIREKLQCKPFKWFMENVAFDLPKKYPPVEPPKGAYGEIRNVAANLCIDTRFKSANERFELEPCIRDNPNQHGGEQNFVLTWHKDIRPAKRNFCFDVSKSSDHAPVVLFQCHQMQGNQQWKYRIGPQQLYHPVSGLCLDCDKERREIFMHNCDTSSETQKWKWENYNSTILARWQ